MSLKRCGPVVTAQRNGTYARDTGKLCAVPMNLRANSIRTADTIQSSPTSPLCVEREQARDDLAVGEVVGPAVGGEDRLVELAVGVGEKRGALVEPELSERGETSVGHKPQRTQTQIV